MPITPSCQSASASDVPVAALLRLGPLADLRDRRAEDPVLHGLPLAVHLLEPLREPPRLVRVVGEQQLERLARMPEPAGGVDARREPEADGALVDDRGIDVRDAHQRAQPGLLRPRERAQPGACEGAVLVHERHDVGDRREPDQVGVLVDRDAERLRELRDDAGAAELLKGIVGRTRRDDRTVGKRLTRAVVIRDDDLEAVRLRAGDLLDGGDAAVDGQDEPAALVGETVERLAREAVALVEAARQMPVRVGAERAQRQNGERGGADPVDVVVAVDADALALRRSPPESCRRPRACPRAETGRAAAAPRRGRQRPLRGRRSRGG